MTGPDHRHRVRRPRRPAPASGPWLTIVAYGLAVLGLWANVIAWSTPIADRAGAIASAALIVAGAVLAGIAHARRGLDLSVTRTATLVALWAAFVGVVTYVGAFPGVVG